MDLVRERPWKTTPLVQTTIGDSESVAAVVTRSIASVRGVPRDRLPPLYEAGDPDALGELFGEAGQGLVAFRYCDFGVVVTASGVVSVHSDVDPGD
ncbi:HalOD1 output domain-containing protein [Halomicrobium urmianum]|uniref:HalOD1 output domain-containing protein n=1 Tax=Halomicrobium urmianum TaxID=1586233 RepID=UPI001CD9BEED|nr:HalOD1 output domain-containing protein [Halomicrobium urmianum]